MAWLHDVMDGRKQKDFYDVLGCSRSSTQEQIKTEYKLKVIESHPDHHPNDAAARARFEELADAYAILGEPEERKNYDAWKASGLLAPYAVWRKEQKEMHAFSHWRSDNSAPSIQQASAPPPTAPAPKKSLQEQFRDYEI